MSASKAQAEARRAPAGIGLMYDYIVFLGRVHPQKKMIFFKWTQPL